MSIYFWIYISSAVLAFLTAGIDILYDGDKGLFDRSYYIGKLSNDSKFEMILTLTLFPVLNTVVALIAIYFDFFTRGRLKWFCQWAVYYIKTFIYKIKWLVWYFKNNQL